MPSSIERYAKTVTPDYYFLLGVKLRPFSLGHYLLMQRFGCAFVDKESKSLTDLPDLGVQDLLLAIMICSRTFEDFQEFITDTEEFNRWCEEWGKAIHTICNQPGFSLTDTFILFHKYLNDGFATPLFFYDDKNNSSSTAGNNWPQAIQLVVTGELGYSLSEAMNLPLSKLFSDYFSYAARNGVLELFTDEQIDLYELSQQQQKGHR